MDSYPLVVSIAILVFEFPAGNSKLEVRLLFFRVSLEMVVLLMDPVVGRNEMECRL